MKKNQILIALCIFIFSPSCRKKENKSTDSTPTSDPLVWVINEGNFSAANGNLTVYNAQEQTVDPTPIEDANGTPLGDVAQSAYTIGDEVWIPINASNKIIILDPETYKIKSQITGITTPRFGCLSGDKFYIGNAFGNQFYSIDISSHQVTSVMVPHAGITDMVAYGGKIYMTASDTANTNIYVYDPSTMTIADSIETYIGKSPQAIELIDDELFVLCGSSWYGIPYTMVRVDLTTADGASNLLPAGEYKDILAYQGKLYLLANHYATTSGPNGVYVYDQSQSNSLQEVVKTPSDVSTFYSFGIDPANGEIYLGDAKSYTVNGEIYRYSNSGELIDNFESGLLPAFFLFR